MLSTSIMFINGILLIVLGAVTVPTLFLPPKWADKIAPYRGYIGLFFLLLGICETAFLLFNLRTHAFPVVVWILNLVCAIAEINLGFMLSQNLLKKLFTKKESREIKTDMIYFKSTMGIIAMGLGFCQIIGAFFRIAVLNLYRLSLLAFICDYQYSVL